MLNLDEARATAQRIVRDGKRASEVIARIRALLGKGQPMRQRFDINEVILEILPLLQAELLRREAKLETELADDLPAVEMDRVQIQQLLMNLMVNALDAMNAVTDRPHVLRIRTSAHEPEAILVAVQDSGMGLSPEQMDRIFDAFYSTKVDGGNGTVYQPVDRGAHEAACGPSQWWTWRCLSVHAADGRNRDRSMTNQPARWSLSSMMMLDARMDSQPHSLRGN